MHPARCSSYSRVSVYNSRNLITQTIDPQIEVLKNSVTMGDLIQQKWVQAWQSPPVTAVAGSFVGDGSPAVINGAAPKVVFSVPGGHIFFKGTFDTLAQAQSTFIGPAISYAPYNGVGFQNSYSWDVTALKGQGTKYVHYVAADGDAPIYIERYATIDVSSSGTVTFNLLAPSDATVTRVGGYVCLPGDPRSGWWWSC